jgi:hypothetical protein
MSEDRFLLGVDFAEPGWIRIMAFDGGGVFLPKRTIAAIGEKDHHRSWAPDHLPAAERANGIREGIKRSQEENIELKVIPLLQGLHTQRESAAASALGLSGRHESSTSTTSSRSRWMKR